MLAQHPAGATAGIGVYNTIVPLADSGTVFPLIVFMVEAFGGEDSMRTRTRRVSITFDVWIDRSPASNAYAPIARGMAILERLEGDWHAQPAGTDPTYGVDRWTPGIGGTGWASDAFQFTNLAAAHTDSQYHWRYEVQGLVSHTAA